MQEGHHTTPSCPQSLHTEMTSKVFNKLYSLLLLLLPKLDMAILAGCNNEVCPGKRNIYFD